MKWKRAYAQVARADETAKTREAILEVAVRLFRDEGELAPPLERVAELAGVSKRTLLRHFGSKDGLADAAITFGQERVAKARAAPPGDVPRALRRLVAHYEELGDSVMRLLAAEERHAAAHRVTDGGKALHRRWVEEVFAPDLAGRHRSDRELHVAALASVTDVYLWSLLRRRYGLSSEKTRHVMSALVERVRQGVS